MVKKSEKSARDGNGVLSTEGELHLLKQLGEQMNAIPELDELLDFVLSRILHMLDSASGSIFLMDEKSGDLILACARGQKAKEFVGQHQKLGRGISGRAALAREPVLVTDISSDERFRSNQKKPGRYETDSFLCVPLISQDRVVAVVNVSEKEGGESFTKQDLELLHVLGNHAASAILVATYLDRLKDRNEALKEQVEEATRSLRISNHQLVEMKKFNESVVASIPQGLVAFDRSYKVLFANQAAHRELDIPSELAEASLVCEWAIEHDEKCWRDELGQVLCDGVSTMLDRAEFTNASGQKLVLCINMTPLREDDGKVFGGLIAVENLENRLEMERRLVTSERLAVLGKLAAKVAHELNTPLDSVKRFISLAVRLSNGDDGIEGYLNDATSGLNRMSDIISSLLKFSRTAHHRFGQIQVNDLIREAISITDHLRVEKNIRLRTHFDEKLPLSSYSNLTSVFANLIKNAYDALDQNGTLHIRSRHVGEKMIVKFADNGCGIAPGFLSRVFDPFFTTKAVGQGTGLGLAICRDIVENYGGEVTVDSEEGRGTTFTVSLPMPADFPSETIPTMPVLEKTEQA